MSELPVTARPRPRAFWADVRFLLGIALVIVSIAGVWFVVAAARQTAPVFAAARTIVPGQAVDADDLRVVEVALGPLEDAYASPATLTPGAVATRTVAAGELVPRDAVGDAAQARTTTIVIRSATAVPAAVAAGARIVTGARITGIDPADGTVEYARSAQAAIIAMETPASSGVPGPGETSTPSKSAPSFALIASLRTTVVSAPSCWR